MYSIFSGFQSYVDSISPQNILTKSAFSYDTHQYCPALSHRAVILTTFDALQSGTILQRKIHALHIFISYVINLSVLCCASCIISLLEAFPNASDGLNDL